MNFTFSIWRYDRKTGESETVGKPIPRWEDADKERVRLRDLDPLGIYSVQENND